MERLEDVPSSGVPRSLWLAFIPDISQWQRLTEDDDWRRLVEHEQRAFGLFTVSKDPATSGEAWLAFADYCVQYELVVVSSWGENSGWLDDTFDMAGVMRKVDGLATAEPLTSWHDDEPLSDAFEFFLSLPGNDLREDDHEPTAWERIALVVGEQRWYDVLRLIAE
ncbi:MAG TPA: hypothetical protein VHC43_17390 [Mycobacteriales bacterium]|nr:hypothetical protein [Mycobacteriales bacterium]